MAIGSSKLCCLYCGTPTTKGGQGEHIVPRAIGGRLTLNDVGSAVVCEACNNGVLSSVDKELCSRSFLSLVASQEIAAHLWQMWDVDHAADNLLVEAKPRWIDGLLKDVSYYPQITFEKTGPVIRGDAEDMASIGAEDFDRVMQRAAKCAFQRYCANEKRAIHLERVETGIIDCGFRLAPRLFTTRPIKTIARQLDKQSFVLRYVTDEDRRFAFKSLDLLTDKPFQKHKQVRGSHVPRISTVFDFGMALRGLLKIAVNLLAAYATSTPINPTALGHTIGIINGRIQLLPPLLDNNGFVRAGQLDTMGTDRKSHYFRLVHVDGMWLVYLSFFGGGIGAAVQFPGPNRENWNTADIVAPIGSKHWTVNTSGIIQLLRVNTEWSDSSKVCANSKVQVSESKIRVEVFRRNRK